MDVGDEDGRDRIIGENRQLRKEKAELMENNESLAKEKKVAEISARENKLAEKGERLLRIGYAINQGGGERVSVM